MNDVDLKKINIEDFSYGLPAGRIANYPLPERDTSKLLVYQDGKLKEDRYLHIADYLPEGALLIFNDTRVVEARILFQKPTGGSIEIFCLSPHERYSDITTAMLQKGEVWWNCLIGGASKWKKGMVLQKEVVVSGKEIILNAVFKERREDSFVIELQWSPSELSFAEVLHTMGFIPLPPYIKRKVEESDNERYQTIYAKQDGSVAAPTAGLHFTDRIFSSLREKNIRHDFITLHVGAGTFKPVKSERIADHVMHTEMMEVRRETIENVLGSVGKVYCVGTTSLRTVESLYWMGVKAMTDPSIEPDRLNISQWEVYESLADHVATPRQSLEALLDWMKRNEIDRLVAETQIMIVPGYSFRMIEGLVTNFHQPRSTLLLLVAALIGDHWKEVYRYAVEHDFRFLSYGDGCLLFI
ncbi:MAG: S-adenosylmethionine:tRNA ribosyltransferase-isomerase [Chitinophagaceae bacterium]|nr:S-adenosylmethionine:tRNA ribosyltransferase-isomerase [Chitinophagaceae bacterium]